MKTQLEAGQRRQPGHRRNFLKEVMSGSALAVVGWRSKFVRGEVEAPGGQMLPWYRKAYRWGQTNINELDPVRYDTEWWRAHWRKTRTQGLVINAGGIIAYYPSRRELQYRAQFLGQRDLYGELVRAAHEDGLVVLARMDSNRAHEEFYRKHADWFAVDREGSPYRADDRYISCIDSPYYEDYLPGILREVIEWERPEGFTDNSWSGLDRDHICYCVHSRRKFLEATGYELPAVKDWNDPVYRAWIEWSYSRRLEIWDLNNRTTKSVGGPDCIWLGMLGGDLVSQGRQFRDVRAICSRSEMVMLDDQGRSLEVGFHENAEMGKRLHGLLGWDKVIPESMAMYQRAPTFRKAAASKPEARLWMISGFAGTIQPWWHHVGAYQWDRRQFTTAEEPYRWYERNQRFLVDRTPVASVGVVYSQQNADFYGQDDANEKVARPYYGFVQALVRRRIPYLPFHVDEIERIPGEIRLLVLPNLAAISDSQAAALRAFADRGGSLVATGETGMLDQWGKRRPKPVLEELFGIHHSGRTHGTLGPADTWTGHDHTYLRLLPRVGSDIYGPLSGSEPAASGTRHPVLSGLEATDIVAFGGLLHEVEAEAGALVPMTFIPHFPAYPPETSWMRTDQTNVPAMVILSPEGSGRRIYLAADLDRRFSRDNLPDHGDLLGNMVTWALKDDLPLRVEGPGFLDCNLYRQAGRLILHVVNLTSAGTWRSPVEEFVPVGPLKFGLRLSGGVKGVTLTRLVREGTHVPGVTGGWASFEVESILDHEVFVLE